MKTKLLTALSPVVSLLASLLAALSLVASAHAADGRLSIEITGAGAERLPITVADFAGEHFISRALVSVVRSDLERSGLFRLLDIPRAMDEKTTPDYLDLKGRGIDALAVGSVEAVAAGYETRFRLHDAHKQLAIAGQAYSHDAGSIRNTAHHIADTIYEKLIGERGIFSTRIAYVVKSKGRFELQIADADGDNAQSAFVSPEPIISLAWSPDGGKLAYVSFQSKKPIVYIHDLASGQRRVVANFKGSNSAPAWSPDGRRLAVVLTKDGGSQIYLINADGGDAVRFTSSSGIDTEPQFSADGEYVYFTSDRGGTPQIYRQRVSGGQAQRITFEGSYNVTPRPAPNGRSMAFITQSGGLFRVAIMDLASRQTQILTDTKRDESPSFAPNSRMILFATVVDGHGVLAAVSSDGRVKQRLSIPAADVREPAWSPFTK